MVRKVRTIIRPSEIGMMVMRLFVAAIVMAGAGAAALPAAAQAELLSGDLRLTVVSQPASGAADDYRKPDHDLNTLDDLYARLRSCWSPPANVVEGMQLTVLFSFDTAGRTIAAPLVTYASPDAPAAAVDAYLESVDVSLTACEPLKLTPALGDAIAGRPIMIRYVDNRPSQSD